MLELLLALFATMFHSLAGFLSFGLPMLLAFALQLPLCLRAKRLAARLIPLFLPAPVMLAWAVFAVTLKWCCGSELLFFLGISVSILLGSLTGWLVYAAAKFLCRPTKKTPYG